MDPSFFLHGWNVANVLWIFFGRGCETMWFEIRPVRKKKGIVSTWKNLFLENFTKKWQKHRQAPRRRFSGSGMAMAWELCLEAAACDSGNLKRQRATFSLCVHVQSCRFCTEPLRLSHVLRPCHHTCPPLHVGAPRWMSCASFLLSAICCAANEVNETEKWNWIDWEKFIIRQPPIGGKDDWLIHSNSQKCPEKYTIDGHACCMLTCVQIS